MSARNFLFGRFGDLLDTIRLSKNIIRLNSHQNFRTTTRHFKSFLNKFDVSLPCNCCWLLSISLRWLLKIECRDSKELCPSSLGATIFSDTEEEMKDVNLLDLLRSLPSHTQYNSVCAFLSDDATSQFAPHENLLPRGFDYRSFGVAASVWGDAGNESIFDTFCLPGNY